MIVWDNDHIRHHKDHRIVATIRTGVSQGVNNFVETLTLIDPAHCADVRASIMWLANRVSILHKKYPAIPNVPVILPYRFDTLRGPLDVTLIWGLVIMSYQGGRMHGEFKFVLCFEDELADVLESAYDFERILVPERPENVSKSKKVGV